MDVAVIVPYRAGEWRRERALAWVVSRLHEQLPGAPVVLGHCRADRPFNRSEAIVDGARRTDVEVFVVSDGDVFCPGLPAAIEAVADGAAWAIPHRMLYRLSEGATARVLAGESVDEQDDFDEKPYEGHEAGTLLVTRREVLLDVPPDVRFRSWGQEDTAWAWALHALVGPPWRGDADCHHLWHEPQPRMTRMSGSLENLDLLRHYRGARNHPRAMRALIEQSKTVSHQDPQPAYLRHG